MEKNQLEKSFITYSAKRSSEVFDPFDCSDWYDVSCLHNFISNLHNCL